MFIRENVCTDREEIDEAEQNTNEEIEVAAEATTEDAATEDAPVEVEETSSQEASSIFSFRMDISTCTEQADKYTCTTK